MNDRSRFTFLGSSSLWQKPLCLNLQALVTREIMRSEDVQCNLGITRALDFVKLTCGFFGFCSS